MPFFPFPEIWPNGSSEKPFWWSIKCDYLNNYFKWFPELDESNESAEANNALKVRTLEG